MRTASVLAIFTLITFAAAPAMAQPMGGGPGPGPGGPVGPQVPGNGPGVDVGPDLGPPADDHNADDVDGNVGPGQPLEDFVIVDVMPTGPTIAAPGDSNVLALAFRASVPLLNQADSLSMFSMGFKFPGSGLAWIDIDEVRLVRDLDANGLVDPTDTQVSAGTFASGDMSITLPVSPWLIVEKGDPVHFVLELDLSMAAISPSSYNVKPWHVNGAAAQTDIAGAGPQTLLVEVPYDPVITVTPDNPLDSTIEPGEANRVMMAMRLSLTGGGVTIDRLRLRGIGSLIDPLHITRLVLHRDANANGLADGNGSNDTLLASGVFFDDDGLMELPVDIDVPNGGGVHLVVSCDLAPGAPTGKTFGFVCEAVDNSADAPVLGLPASSASMTVALAEAPADPAGNPGSTADGGNGLADDLAIATSLSAGCSTGRTSAPVVQGALLVMLLAGIAVRRRT